MPFAPEGGIGDVPISKGGYGKQGYCKLCSFQDLEFQLQFDKRIDAGWSPSKLNEWLEQHGSAKVDRGTVYSHREHVRNPRDRMVSAVAKRTAELGVMPAKVSEDEYLEAIIAAASVKVQSDPQAVTIDQGLKAAQIRSNMKSKGQDLNVLIAMFTGKVPDDTIEGEFRDA